MPKLTNTISITQLKARTKMLQRQLGTTSIMLLQTCRKCFNCQDGCKGKTLYELRELINRAKTNNDLYMVFYNNMIKLVPNISDLIEKGVECQIEYLKLETCISKTELGTYIIEPVLKLWHFLLKLLFEKPTLLVEKEDSKDGILVNIVRESLPFFIASCVPITSTCSLTTEIVEEVQGDKIRISTLI